MDILISFSVSVVAVEAVSFFKNIAIDLTNKSIVLWVKNKKIPSPNGRINSRDINKKRPPLNVFLPGMWVYITFVSRFYYSYEKEILINGGIWERERIEDNGLYKTTTTNTSPSGESVTDIDISGSPGGSGSVLQRLSLLMFMSQSFTPVTQFSHEYIDTDGASDGSGPLSDYVYREERSFQVSIRSFYVLDY